MFSIFSFSRRWAPPLLFVPVLLAAETKDLPNRCAEMMSTLGERFPIERYKELLEADTSGKKLQIKIVRGVGDPIVKLLPEKRVLRIPETFLTANPPDRIHSFLKQLLIGHPLHPQIQPGGKNYLTALDPLSQSRLQLRLVQQHGIEAGIKAQNRKDPAFLYVSPTGTGKTEVLVGNLDYRLDFDKRKLHIVVAQQKLLVNQLVKDLRDVLGERCMLLPWGGKNKATSIEDLLRKVESSPVPVILVTTTQSFNPRLFEYHNRADDLTWQKFVRQISSFTFDEAHHFGAEQTRTIKKLLKSPDIFFMGTTATPIHHQANVLELFDNHAFWAYLDTPETYRADSKFERAIESILDQLYLAIHSGDLTPFDEIHLLTPNDFQVENFDQVFTPSQLTGAIRIDAHAFADIEKKILPLLQKHPRGFISVGSIEEAEEFARYLNESNALKGKTFKAFHSSLGNGEDQEIEEAFRRGEIDYLVTIRKLDEALNYPDLSLYIDLNRTIGVRQLIQRIGRVLRLSIGKEGVDIVMMTDMREGDVRANLAFLKQVKEGRFSGDQQWVGARGRRKKANLSDLGELILTVERFFRSHQSIADWREENRRRRCEELSQFVINRKRLPSRQGQHPGELKLSDWLSRARGQWIKDHPEDKNNPEPFFKSVLSLEAYAVWSSDEFKGHRFHERRVAELNQFLLDRHAFPSHSADDDFESSLAQWVTPAKRRWFKEHPELDKKDIKLFFRAILSDEAFLIWEEIQSNGPQPQDQRQSHLNRFVLHHRRLPRQKGGGPVESSLAAWQANTKRQWFKDHPEYAKEDSRPFFKSILSDEAYEIWNSDEYSGAKNYIRRREELSQFIENRNRMPKQDPKDPIEHSLAAWLTLDKTEWFRRHPELDKSDPEPYFREILTPTAFQKWNSYKFNEGRRSPIRWRKTLSEFFVDLERLPTKEFSVAGERSLWHWLKEEKTRHFKDHPDSDKKELTSFFRELLSQEAFALWRDIEFRAQKTRQQWLTEFSNFIYLKRRRPSPTSRNFNEKSLAKWVEEDEKRWLENHSGTRGGYCTEVLAADLTEICNSASGTNSKANADSEILDELAPDPLNSNSSLDEGARSERLVELRGMQVALEHYSRKGFDCRDTSKNKSYDYSCWKDGLEVRLEVKGKSNQSTRIRITPDEALHAWSHAMNPNMRVDLVVVTGIQLRKSPSGPEAVGGVPQIKQSWNPERSELRIECYSTDPFARL